MKTILIVFRKELLDSLRDRRTLITMIVIPLLLFPLLFGISTRIMVSQAKKAQEKTLRIGLLSAGNAAEFRQDLLRREDVRLSDNLAVDIGRSLVEGDSLDAFIVIDGEFDRQVAEMQPGKIELFFKSTERRDILKDRLVRLIKDYEERLRTRRYEKLKLQESMFNTVDLKEQNLASAKEKLAEVIGGFLPYLFIIFCYLGCMYPAIDLAAGEKERGTLETLLTAPATRMQILLGKFGVVVSTGISSAIVSFVGLYVGIRQIREIPTEMLSTVLGILELKSILMLVSLLLPLTIFFAAVLLSISIFARSYKEAQSSISPMMIVVIIPAFLGLMPGIKLDPTTALVPILNVSLATKAIIAGTATLPILVEVYVSLVLLAGASLYICSKVFERESTIFRGA